MAIDLSDTLAALERAIDAMADAESALETERQNSVGTDASEEIITAIEDMLKSVSNMQAKIDGLKNGFEERFKS